MSGKHTGASLQKFTKELMDSLDIDDKGDALKRYHRWLKKVRADEKRLMTNETNRVYRFRHRQTYKEHSKTYRQRMKELDIERFRFSEKVYRLRTRMKRLNYRVPSPGEIILVREIWLSHGYPVDNLLSDIEAECKLNAEIQRRDGHG